MSDLDPTTQAMLSGMREQSKWCVGLAREGNLRIAAHPGELGERPYEKPIRPIRATRSIWRQWWRETKLRIREAL